MKETLVGDGGPFIQGSVFLKLANDKKKLDVKFSVWELPLVGTVRKFTKWGFGD